MADNDWEARKAEIERLYIGEKMPLPKLIKYMAGQGFSKTKAQYTRQFRKWGFSRYQKLPRGVDWGFIDRRRDRRKRLQGKESELVLHGIRYSPEKLRKILYNKAHTSTFDRFSGAVDASPPTPEGIMVRTPGSASPAVGSPFDTFSALMHQLTWMPSLPWLRFRKLLQSEIDQGSTRLSLLLPSSQSLSSQGLSTQSAAIKVKIMRRAALSVLMPEEFEGQHQALAATCLTLDLYLLSNGFIPQDAPYSSEDTIRSHDMHVIKSFKSLGSDGMSQFVSAVKAQEPTVEAVAEKLFASAVRVLDIRVVRMMLRAGINADNVIEIVGDRVTPLAWAAHITDSRGLDLAKLLISHKASVNEEHRDITALLPAIRSNNQAVIRLLLDNDAVVSLSCLAEAGRTVDLELFNDLLKSCKDDLGMYRETLYNPDTRNSNYFKSNTDHRIHGYTTLLGAAAKSGRLDIIDLVLKDYPSLVNPPRYAFEQPYYSPLEIAIAMGHTACIEPLILAGVDMETTSDDKSMLTVYALDKNNLEAFEILLRYNARIDRPLSCHEAYISALFAAIKLEYDDIVGVSNNPPFTSHDHLIYRIIQQGARLNDENGRQRKTVLAAAIELGNPAIIDLLLDCGAITVGRNLDHIGSLDAAQLLGKRGILRPVLHANRMKIAENAMLSQNLDVARWLVNNKFFGAVDCTSAEKDTLLDAAVATGDVFLVETILKYGAVATDERITGALRWIEKTCTSASSNLLQLLLRAFRGNAPSAVAYAALARRPDLMSALLRANVSPNGIPRLPLGEGDWARYDPQSPMSGYIVLGSSVNKPQSALELAVEGRSTQCLEMLIQAHQWGPKEVGRALALSIYYHERAMVEQLYKLDANKEEEGSICAGEFLWGDWRGLEKQIEYFTPLQAAAMTQNVALVQRLIEVDRVDVNHPAKGSRGRTALQHAVENGNLELMDMFLKHDADVNGAPAYKEGATALQLASIKGYYNIACKLIDLGAEVNAAGTEWEGRTAIEGAAEHGRLDILQLLLENGAAVFDDEGRAQCRNAIGRARDNGHYAAAKLIESFHPDWEAETARFEELDEISDHLEISSEAEFGGGESIASGDSRISDYVEDYARSESPED
ncbi:ankyrin repeat-containing domain protein [Aspergillus pseudoustus]|uniref:Ankyrin repeat-containing domain protein n=1 Tax=Aspergillus pseudoustus TaxID=1810923 RepID=A0ABR4IJD3_9EURO